MFVNCDADGAGGHLSQRGLACPSIDSMLSCSCCTFTCCQDPLDLSVCDADGAGGHLSQRGLTFLSIDSMLSHVVVLLLHAVKLSLTSVFVTPMVAVAVPVAI